MKRRRAEGLRAGAIRSCWPLLPFALVLIVGSARSTADNEWVPEAERATIDEGMRVREPLTEQEEVDAMDPGSAQGCRAR